MKITEEKERGNTFYDVQYRNNEKAISISYENSEDYLQVIIFLLEGGSLPDYDNKIKTLHLNFLNSSIISSLSSEEINSNARYFSLHETKNNLERKLLKAAKELRLYLKYFDQPA